MGAVALIGLVIVLAFLLLVAFGNPWIAVLPVVVCGLLYMFLVLPIRAPLFLLIFLAALADWQPVELPSKEIYYPVVNPLTKVLFENLNNVLPIEALRFSAVDLLYVSCALILLVRMALKVRMDTRDRQPATVMLLLALGAAFAAVLWLLVWGIGARGGDFRQSLWQARQLFWLPVVTVLFTYALRDVRDFHRALNLMILAAVMKTAMGAWFMLKIARPLHFEPQSLTSHYDSILFVIAIVTLAARFVHRGTWKNLALLVIIGSFIGYGIVINNRRLAFVNLLVDLFLIYIMLQGPVKAFLRRAILLSIPFVVVYIAIGQQSNRRYFKPAKLIMSVVKQEDRSSSTRDIENYNLLVTLKRNKLLGSGWGHEYIEQVKADDISHLFEQYKFMAHNSILWLWTIGGYVGFTLIWMPISLGIFFARRAYLFATTWQERSAAAICVSMLATYMMQAWGDLGTQGLNATLTAALALAMGAKLAVSTGGFPARVRLFGHHFGSTPVEVTVGRQGAGR